MPNPNKIQINIPTHNIIRKPIKAQTSKMSKFTKY